MGKVKRYLMGEVVSPSLLSIIEVRTGYEDKFISKIIIEINT